MTVAAFTLSGSSAAGIAYDVVCKVDAQTVTRAVSAALLLYPVVGMLQAAANPSNSCQVVLDGFIPPSLTGLAALAGKGRVNGTTARVERVASLGGSDYPIGDIDANGYLDLQVDPISVGTRAEVEALTTPRHNAYVYCTEAQGPYSFDSTSSAAVTGTTVLAADDGTRGRWLYTAFSADSAFVSSFGRYIRPDGTADQLAELQAATDDANTEWAADRSRRRVVRIGPGTLRISAQAHRRSGVDWVGEQATISPHSSWTPDVGLADDPTNALVLAQGTVSTATVNTTITAAARRDSLSITVASATGIAAGMWLRLQGYNAPGGDEPQMSDDTNNILTEMVKVAASYVSGTTIPLSTPVNQSHNSGCTVAAVTPIQDFATRGIRFDAAGGTHSNGMLIEYATNVEIADVSAKGFSRFVIEPRLGTREITIDGLDLYGEVNGAVNFDSAMLGRARGIFCHEGGLREHAHGIPRPLLWFQERSTSIRVSDCTLAHADGGIRLWGGHYLHFENINILDMDSTQWIALDAHLLGGITGSGIDMGAGGVGAPYPDAAFGYGCTFTNVHLTNCRHPTTGVHCALHYHDWFGAMFSNITITNTGLAGYTTGRGMAGVVMKDCIGRFDSLTIRGCQEAIITGNVFAIVDIDYLELDGVDGAGNQNATWIYLDHVNPSSPLNQSPRISRLKLSNTAGDIRFGSQFAANPDWNFHIDEMVTDGTTIHTNVWLVDNNSGTGCAVGDIMMLDPASAAGTRKIKPPTGAVGGCVVVASADVSTGKMLASLCPVTTAFVTGAVAVSDLIESNADRKGRVNNASAVAVGRAITTKAAGTGLVLLGPK